MSAHIETQERSLALKLQRSPKLQTIQTLLTKLIIEDLTLDGRLILESKKALKLAVEILVDDAWKAADTQGFGPKSTASKVPQLNISSEAFSPERTQKKSANTGSNRTTKSRSRRTLSDFSMKRLESVESSPCLSPSVSGGRKLSIYTNFNGSLMSRSEAEAMSMSGFCSVVGPATFGASKRKLTQGNPNSPGPSSYCGDRLALKLNSPKTVFAKGSPKKYYELGTKTPGPAAYYPIPQLASKRK